MLDAVGAFKQVIIQKGKVPALNMFGRATINPNGNVPKHTHANMDEVRGMVLSTVHSCTQICKYPILRKKQKLFYSQFVEYRFSTA